METNADYNQEKITIKNIHLPIGTGKVYGDIEDFEITIYDRTGRTYDFRVIGGNICTCNSEDVNKTLEYEVK